MADTDDTRRTIDDGRPTTPGVWHKLPTGELKILFMFIRIEQSFELRVHLTHLVKNLISQAQMIGY